MNQQVKKGVTVLAGVIDPDAQGQTGPPFNNEDKKENVWIIIDPLRCLLVLP